jgi:16S rRNA (uracil1498-N3)-methyltransferase
VQVRVRRIYHPEVPGPGERIDLSREESHHVSRVLRLREGDGLSVFDGRGGEWSGEVLEANPANVAVRVGEPLDGRVDPGLPIDLYQGLCRHDRMEWVVQKGTEIGVGCFTPMINARVESGRPAGSRIRRWRRIALEACKQSGRRCLPVIRDPVPLPGAPPAGELGMVLHPGSGSVPIGEILGRDRPAGVLLAVGPEGGFEGSEIGTLQETGWITVHLGPRVLRTETAGIVAAALCLHAWGDLGRPAGG